MTNFDLLLERFGLCRIKFYAKMKQSYAQIISMKTKQVKRAQDENARLIGENIDLKTQLIGLENQLTLARTRGFIHAR